MQVGDKVRILVGNDVNKVGTIAVDHGDDEYPGYRYGVQLGDGKFGYNGDEIELVEAVAPVTSEELSYTDFFIQAPASVIRDDVAAGKLLKVVLNLASISDDAVVMVRLEPEDE